MAVFDLCVGVDYSGAANSASRSATIQVYSAGAEHRCQIVRSPISTTKRRRNWCRREVAEWLIELVASGQRIIAGIDHGFSFPISYFHRYELTSWANFLDDFCAHWPTSDEGVTVDGIRKASSKPPQRTGLNTDFRVTEAWTSSAKSVFLFDVQGSVAKSTHAGLSWLRHVRDHVGDQVHFWPFDGWDIPDGKSAIAEVYPSIFKRRFPVEERSPDQQDAYAVARWLQEMDESGRLQNYLRPQLSKEDYATAELEGWILGVS